MQGSRQRDKGVDDLATVLSRNEYLFAVIAGLTSIAAIVVGLPYLRNKKQRMIAIGFFLAAIGLAISAIFSLHLFPQFLDTTFIVTACILTFGGIGSAWYTAYHNRKSKGEKIDLRYKPWLLLGAGIMILGLLMGIVACIGIILSNRTFRTL